MNIIKIYQVFEPVSENFSVISEEIQSAQIFNWNFIEPFFNIILGVITIIIGANYIKAKRNDAKFGFYINIYIYMIRLQKFLKEYPRICQNLFTSNVRNELFVAQFSHKNIETMFTSLCSEVLQYISTASNNIPPQGKRKSPEWSEWYCDMNNLTFFLQQCAFIDKGITPYTDPSDKEDYEQLINNANKAIERIINKLSAELQIKEKENEKNKES
ncbi:MAG: hypothetical protein J6Q94_01250 [Clostridia bacterium]|nr:hypothetical protein [Clostridia bacterium]